jgi:hypothetical protein
LYSPLPLIFSNSCLPSLSFFLSHKPLHFSLPLSEDRSSLSYRPVTLSWLPHFLYHFSTFSHLFSTSFIHKISPIYPYLYHQPLFTIHQKFITTTRQAFNTY